MRANVTGAGLSAQLSGSVLVVEVVGMATADTVRCIRAWVAPRMAGADGIVIDYSRTALAITESDLRELGRPGAYLLQKQPMAWVVPDEETAAMWRRQAFRIALAGERRFASCDFGEALAWAREQARLAKAA